jgi:hypothetical protein
MASTASDGQTAPHCIHVACSTMDVHRA